jgi:hypothetical protein
MKPPTASGPDRRQLRAKIVGALAEVRPCTHLCRHGAGGRHGRIRSKLFCAGIHGDGDTTAGFRFADAVVRPPRRTSFATPSAPSGARRRIDLTLALQMGRMFPMVKAGSVMPERRVTVDGNNVDVVKQAA